ncbi:MAG: EamA family transporter [Candidatus Rokuibacteriota bacterium]
MPSAYVLLLGANILYATTYVVSRVVLDDVPAATLALLRLVLGAAVLVPIAWRAARDVPDAPGERARIFWMGALGFAGAFVLGNWGVERSTATNAALLIIVEPVALMLLGPLLFGERLRRREAVGAALALAGSVIVVINGVPGVSVAVAPHWRGDLLLVASGLAYAAYSLFGRPVLDRHPATVVTARSIVWGAAVMAPFAAGEWMAGARPVLTPSAVVGTLYLAVIITAFGYLVWNYALARVGAARAGIFVNVQPVVGALLGVVFLGDALTPFTVTGGALIVGGLWLTVSARPDGIL